MGVLTSSKSRSLDLASGPSHADSGCNLASTRKPALSDCNGDCAGRAVRSKLVASKHTAISSLVRVGLRVQGTSCSHCVTQTFQALKREFPKIRGTLFWGPYNEDPTMYGTILGSPIFGNPQTCPNTGALIGRIRFWGVHCTTTVLRNPKTSIPKGPMYRYSRV